MTSSPLVVHGSISDALKDKKKKEFILELIKHGLYLQYISLDQYEENSC